MAIWFGGTTTATTAGVAMSLLFPVIFCMLCARSPVQRHVWEFYARYYARPLLLRDFAKLMRSFLIRQLHCIPVVPKTGAS